MIGANRQHKGSGVVIGGGTVKKRIAIAVGIDAGSTETRVCVADADDVRILQNDSKVAEALDIMGTTYSIPSTYATYADSREIIPLTENLEDNYDSHVILIECKANQPLLGRQRVLRGSKASGVMGLVPLYLDSSTNKTDNTIFYTNIIDSIGYAVLQKYNGAVPTEVVVYLTLSVRPKELTAKCKQVMIDNLKGTFTFAWRGMKDSISISIEIAGLDFTTEPEAEIEGTLSICDLRAAAGINPEENTAQADLLADSSCFIHIEGGGSSVGVEVLRNRKIIDACSSTFQLGGNYLSQLFIDRYREETGRTITREAADNAIITCELRDGRNVLDVSKLVAQCKDQVGRDILERLRHQVIDVTSDLTLRDVEFITLGGRLFKPDGADNTIAGFFGDYVHQISDKTEIVLLPENLIAQGNLLSGLSDSFADEILKTSDAGAEEEQSAAGDNPGGTQTLTFSDMVSEFGKDSHSEE